MDDWDPEKEKDPEKVQAEMLALGKEMLENLKKDADRKKQEEEAFKREMAASPPQVAYAYRPPTLQEISARLKRAWEETKKIDPEAPPLVQVKMLEVLFQAAWESQLPGTSTAQAAEDGFAGA